MPFLARPGRPQGERRRDADQRRGTAAERGYNATWQKKAAAFKRLYPLCGMRPNGLPPVMSRCFEQGISTPAFQVDHVVPHRGDPRLFNDLGGNAQSLCQRCGAAKSRAGL